MNAWEGAVISYLEERRAQGSRDAAALLARRDCPRHVVKGKIASVEHHEKEQRKAVRAEEAAIGRMHDEVWGWNLTQTFALGAPFGRCDCGCGYVFRHTAEGELDHWKGRRGPNAHTRENGWRLRTECHEEKDGRRPRAPGSPTFNERRRAYCERAGIPFVPRKELAP